MRSYSYLKETRANPAERKSMVDLRLNASVTILKENGLNIQIKMQGFSDFDDKRNNVQLYAPTRGM